MAVPEGDGVSVGTRDFDFLIISYATCYLLHAVYYNMFTFIVSSSTPDVQGQTLIMF